MANFPAKEFQCGSTIKSPTGVLNAPDWRCDPQMGCLWVLNASQGTRIRYRAFVDVEESKNCTAAFLKVSRTLLRRDCLSVITTSKIPTVSNTYSIEVNSTPSIILSIISELVDEIVDEIDNENPYD